MKRSFALLSVGIVSLALSGLLNVCAAPNTTTTAKITKAADFPKTMTGMDTNISVQLLRVFRCNVPEFGRNNVVIVQYRLRKEGPRKPGPMYKAWFDATDIKLRDSLLCSAYETIRGVHEHETYSKTAMTSEWEDVGRTGDGYAWFKIPPDVKTVDIYMPYTKPFMHVPIEIPKG